MSIYNNLKKQAQPHSLVINHHFHKGAFVEIKGNTGDKFLVQFFGSEGLLYESIIQCGEWAKCTLQYYIPYRISIVNLSTQKKIKDIRLNLKGRKVHIELDSKALGDTLAWMPYLEEFRKEHGCELLATTYHNSLFINHYPHIRFLEPGSAFTAYATYQVGWYYQEGKDLVNLQRNPHDPKAHPLQKTASDILGLSFQELRPRLDFKRDRKPIRDKYVCIANHATLQAKYWNHPTGWQQVVDHLKQKGYKVVLLSREEDGSNGNYNPKGVELPKDYQLSTIMNYLQHCAFFIGIGSGLSWLSWAMKKPTVLISGFSESYTEMQDCTRITAPEGACSGCFNWVRLQNDGDFNWCPRFKNHPRMFECSRLITPERVIGRIEHLI